MQSVINATLRRAVIDRLAQEIFHFDVLEGNCERSATWEGTTEADRQHYRARARRELRQQDGLALKSAMRKAKDAAFTSLPPSARVLLASGEGRKAFDQAIECAIAAREAQLLHGREEQEQRRFEQLHHIPAERAFEVVPGGKA